MLCNCTDKKYVLNLGVVMLYIFAFHNRYSIDTYPVGCDVALEGQHGGHPLLVVRLFPLVLLLLTLLQPACMYGIVFDVSYYDT